MITALECIFTYFLFSSAYKRVFSKKQKPEVKLVNYLESTENLVNKDLTERIEPVLSNMNCLDEIIPSRNEIVITKNDDLAVKDNPTKVPWMSELLDYNKSGKPMAIRVDRDKLTLLHKLRRQLNTRANNNQSCPAVFSN